MSIKTIILFGVIVLTLVVSGLPGETKNAFADSSKQLKGFGHVHVLVVHPQNETLLAGTHQGLFRSQDAGVTWERTKPKGEVPGHDFMSFAMHPQQFSQIYASGHDIGILRSDDFGQTWQRSDSGIPSADVHAVVVDSHKPQQLYAWVSEDGLYRSKDRGKTLAPG